MIFAVTAGMPHPPRTRSIWIQRARLRLAHQRLLDVHPEVGLKLDETTLKNFAAFGSDGSRG